MAQLLPEWHPTRAVLLAWPFPDSDWQANLQHAQECYWQMLAALLPRTDVWLLLHPDLDRDVWLGEFGRRALTLPGLRRAGLTLISDIPYNDTWIRDYGPLSRADGYAQFHFNGWGGKFEAHLDDAVGDRLKPLLGAAPAYISFAGVEPVAEGGAVEVNGQGDILVNADCIVDDNRNPGMSRADWEMVFAQAFGCSRVHWLEEVQLTGDDTDGHIDTIVRFAPGNKLVYSGPNTAHPDAGALSSLHRQVTALANRYQWEAVALPTPHVTSTIYSGEVLPATYANFLVCNQTVVAPVYGCDEDAAALAALHRAFTGYQIVPVRCEALLEQHGSLHCATMQLSLIN